MRPLLLGSYFRLILAQRLGAGELRVWGTRSHPKRAYDAPRVTVRQSDVDWAAAVGETGDWGGCLVAATRWVAKWLHILVPWDGCHFIYPKGEDSPCAGEEVPMRG